jgi:hypothetical protein
VAANGPSRGKFIPGTDVIVEVLFPGPRRPVSSVADLQNVLGKVKEGDIVSLLIYDTRPNVRDTRVVNLRVGG